MKNWAQWVLVSLRGNSIKSRFVNNARYNLISLSFTLHWRENSSDRWLSPNLMSLWFISVDFVLFFFQRTTSRLHAERFIMGEKRAARCCCCVVRYNECVHALASFASPWNGSVDLLSRVPRDNNISDNANRTQSFFSTFLNRSKNKKILESSIFNSVSRHGHFSFFPPLSSMNFEEKKQR